MVKPIIILDGHSTRKNSLVLVDDKKIQYKLVTPFSDALRVGADPKDRHKIEWIDPAGGPMIKLGYRVNNLELVSIFHSTKHKAFILEFKEV